jgi:Zn-finger nucleic acid-binding protein
MKLKSRLLLLAGSLGLATVLSSCETTGTADTAAGSEAVMCDKCKTVWVKQATNLGPPGQFRTTVYRDQKKMTCPDCELAIANFWKTGQMKHSCSHCGGALVHCTQH